MAPEVPAAPARGRVRSPGRDSRRSATAIRFPRCWISFARRSATNRSDRWPRSRPPARPWPPRRRGRCAGRADDDHATGQIDRDDHVGAPGVSGTWPVSADDGFLQTSRRRLTADSWLTPAVRLEAGAHPVWLPDSTPSVPPPAIGAATRCPSTPSSGRSRPWNVDAAFAREPEASPDAVATRGLEHPEDVTWPVRERNVDQVARGVEWIGTMLGEGPRHRRSCNGSRSHPRGSRRSLSRNHGSTPGTSVDH